MIQIISPRRSGKTARLIKLAAENNLYIVTRNEQHSRAIQKMARDMDLKIPYPVAMGDIINDRNAGTSLNRDGVLVDDALDILQELFPFKINGVTINLEEDQ